VTFSLLFLDHSQKCFNVTLFFWRENWKEKQGKQLWNAYEEKADNEKAFIKQSQVYLEHRVFLSKFKNCGKQQPVTSITHFITYLKQSRNFHRSKALNKSNRMQPSQRGDRCEGTWLDCSFCEEWRKPTLKSSVSKYILPWPEVKSCFATHGIQKVNNFQQEIHVGDS
jgi:hypothetical protein